MSILQYIKKNACGHMHAHSKMLSITMYKYTYIQIALPLKNNCSHSIIFHLLQCLAECILTEARYMQQSESLNFDNIRADLQTKFNNDSLYTVTMLESFRKCLPNAQRKMQAYKQMPMANSQLKRGCSPFAGMLLGCTYMEYFKNCPAHRWTENPQCALAKQFVTQCALGA